MVFKNFLPERWRERTGGSSNKEMHHLRHRIDQMFEDFFNMPMRGSSMFEKGYAPFCDCEETSTHYLVSFDLPGVKKDDVKIDLNNNQLTISGERKSRQGHESHYGSFYQSFTLPANIDPEQIEANFENGVLQIAIPKTKTSTGKQILIKEGKLLENKEKEKK